MNITQEKNIITMNNLDKYNTMITYLVQKKYIQLSTFIQPWIHQQKDANIETYKGHKLFISNGNYFEFLRWLAFKMIKEDKYINLETYNLIIFFENGMDLTGIFRIKQGGLFDLLSTDELMNIFNYTNEIITISNSQLVIFITGRLGSNKTAGKKSKTKKLTHTKTKKLIKKKKGQEKRKH